jgi:hypothetical protein
MRLKRRRRKHRSSAGLFALVAIGAVVLAAGCQGPQFDHVDGSSATFNANRIPTVDRQQPVAESKSQTGISPSASSDAPGSATQSAAAPSDASLVEDLNHGHREAALNHLERAEFYYRRVLEREPENPVANHRLAVIADKKHDFSRAENYYLMALHRDERNPDLLGDLGYSYLLQGRREESERCLLTATRIDPSHAKALHNLSLLYAMSGDYDRSFDALRRAVGDSEARVKIARLFPNGHPSATDGDAMIASFQPSGTRDDSSSAAADNSVELPPTDTTRPSAPIAATEPAWTDPPADTNPSTPRSDEVTGGQNTRVPDSRINDIFAAIDREESREPQAAPIASTPPVQMDAHLPATAPQTSFDARGVGAGGFDARDLQAAPGADPLASMPLWPPPASASQRRNPPAAFLFNAEDSSSTPPQSSPSPKLPGPRSTESPLPGPPSTEAPLLPIQSQPLDGAPIRVPTSPVGKNDLSANRSAAFTDEIRDSDSMSPTIVADPLNEVAQKPISTYPHVIPTGIVPTGAIADKPRASRNSDAPSEYEIELQQKSGILSGVRTQSNAGVTREPSIVPRPKVNLNGVANQFDATRDASLPSSFEAAPTLRIQPQRTPAPLFEPVEGFGPANDFAPRDNAAIPAWPSTNGSPADSIGDIGPTIHPRSSN